MKSENILAKCYKFDFLVFLAIFAPFYAIAWGAHVRSLWNYNINFLEKLPFPFYYVLIFFGWKLKLYIDNLRRKGDMPSKKVNKGYEQSWILNAGNTSLSLAVGQTLP
jgi:hypothetical protein